MSDCVFCKIVAGQIPCHKVYEDKDCIAFLDIHPLNPGHVLVVPRKHVQWHYDLDENDYKNIMAVVRRISLAQVKALGALTVSLLTMGFDVPHTHIQLIPRWIDDDHRHKGIDATAIKNISPEEMASIANKIWTAMNN